eukprot:scaffold232018_cov45-Attheya_sp.AAC.1
MDYMDFNVSKVLLTHAEHVLDEAVARARAVPNYWELSNLSNELRTRKAEVADFIVPNLDGNGDIDISGWESAHVDITIIWDETKFVSNQAKLRRLGVADNLLSQPFFKIYDDTIFHPTAEGERGLTGLTGPQGFGKSVFALKQAFGAGDTLVVWVPTCPETIYNVNVSLADGFYRGCRARHLNGIPYMKNSNSVQMSLNQMKSFADTNGKKLLIIIDQMNCKLECFDSLKQCIQDYVLRFDGRGHRVFLSYSTRSRTAYAKLKKFKASPRGGYMSTPGSELSTKSSGGGGQSNQKWDDMLQCLEEFIVERRKEETKDMTEEEKKEWEWEGNVPATYKTKCGKALGRWINNQRSAKSKCILKREREDRLMSTGLKWSVLTTHVWTDMMEELRIYVKEKTKDGEPWDGNVPTNYRIKGNTADDGTEIDKEKNLGRWINRQRCLFQGGKLK